MHCPFTSEISVKRERGILILVMRYFYWLFLSRCRYVRRTPPPPPFTPLFVHCCVQECSFYFWYFSSKLDVSRVVSVGFLNEEFYLLYRYWWNTRNIFPFTKNHIFIARSEDIKRMLTVCLSICPRSFEESDQGHPTIISVQNHWNIALLNVF